MGYPVELEPAVDIYGPDGIPESIVMFNEGLEDVPEIASRNMRMGHVVSKVIFEHEPTTPELNTQLQK